MRCQFVGAPVRIERLGELTAYRGKLLSGGPGTPVHAASFLRERRIVLDTSLRGSEFTRILLHELFHFAWVRLSNRTRAEYTDLITAELARHGRGELGWSSEWRKKELIRRTAPRFFREYICESFCDTAAWRYGTRREHDEVTLAVRWRQIRERWFDDTFPQRKISI
ncbi:hypothetical protein F183_A19200 [Bryobacterales bacterium F-183]|nr:hypothetical protein F183_A19200 [Bryobacterales bacterium F-183]